MAHLALRIGILGLSTLIAVVFLGACHRAPSAQVAPSPPMSNLSSQVKDYLYADDLRAEALLSGLSEHAVDELEVAVRRALVDPPTAVAPTGMLPNQPIRVGKDEFSYALYVPVSYTAARAYPLIICLHGAGFSGDAYLDRWQPRLKEEYILVCPSIPDGAWWTREAETLVLAVLAEISRIYRIDPDRVVLTGMSNGGIGTFLIGTNHADRFAAFVPMASAYPHALYPLLDNARSVPFYIIHGSRDQVMPIRFSRALAAYLESHDFQVVFREHDKEHPMAGGHFFPREELPDLVAWLATQHRGPVPRHIVAVRDRDHTDRSYWVRIDETTPDVASFWTSEYDAEESRRLENGAWARLEASIENNLIQVQSERVVRYTLFFDRALVKLDQPIRVVTNGTTSFEGRVEPNARLLLEDARARFDPERLMVAAVTVAVKL